LVTSSALSPERRARRGGTCLKKCFFETYRFSEDLDFTLRDAAHLDETFLKKAFAEVGAWIYDETGIEFPGDKQEFATLVVISRAKPRSATKDQFRQSLCPVSS
jgi:predicted nucleotidyltransferase component of viral defense system